MATALEFEYDGSVRVNSVDFHPSEPWILVALHNGSIQWSNYQNKENVGDITGTESPVRSAKFIARKHWIVTGADDKYIRVYNYDTMELIKEFEAHQQVIRSVCAHHTHPYVLSASDDMLIKMWNWENDWGCVNTFQGHANHVMQVAFNPRETDVFASASLDNTVKIWKLDAPAPIASLDGHSNGVNSVDYFTRVGKLCLVSGSNDRSIKVWDNETKSCVKTLEGHASSVTAVTVHPDRHIIISGAEDGQICMWDAQTFRLRQESNSFRGSVRATGCNNGLDKAAVGCDEGTVMVIVPQN